MTITYELGNSLYINITNRCTNHCTFCVRNQQDGVGSGINLWLKQEPTVEEVITDIRNRELTNYQELVFCGYGEPMIRTDDIIKICQKLKALYNIPIRINTNGHANLIYGKDITPQLAGLIDAVSISLTAKDSGEYQAVCRSDYGGAAFDAMLDFAGKCKQHIPKVVLSVVDVISREDIAACRAIAEGLGVDFRVRHFAE